MNTILLAYPERGAALYCLVFNAQGQVYDGSDFEAFNAAHWLDYARAMSQLGVSGVFSASFPAVSAGTYAVVAYLQAGTGPAQTDALAGSAVLEWDGTALGPAWTGGTLGSAISSIPSVKVVTDQLATALEADGGTYRFTANALEQAPDSGDATAANQASLLAAVTALNDLSASEVNAAIVAVPGRKLDVDVSGRVAPTTDGIAAQVWSASGRELSTPPPTAAQIATTVWGAVSRTLTSFGVLETRLTEVRAGFLDHISTILSTTDKLDDTLENDSGTYRFTANALEQAPDSGDATAANQASLLAAIEALPTAADVADQVLAGTVDGTVNVQGVLSALLSFAAGKVVKSSDAPVTLDFYDRAGTAVLFRLVLAADGSGRNLGA